jgi:nicotinamidase-related amidase
MQNDKYRPVGALPNETSLSSHPIITSTHLLTKVNECITAARERSWKVVFALDVHHPKHVSFQTQRPHCVMQTWGADVVKGLQFGFDESDLVYRGLDTDKDSDDAFYVSVPGSPSHLRFLMSEQQATTLCLCGASPEGCIEQTARTAHLLGYSPLIISDCSILLPSTTHHTTTTTPYYSSTSLASLLDAPILEG